MFARLDAGPQVYGAEMWGRRQQNHIDVAVEDGQRVRAIGTLDIRREGEAVSTILTASQVEIIEP